MKLATRCKSNGCETFAFPSTRTDADNTILSHLRSATMNLDALAVRYKQLIPDPNDHC